MSTKTLHYIVATVRIVDKNVLADPIDYMFNVSAKEVSELFISEKNLGDPEKFAFTLKESGLNWYDALTGSGNSQQTSTNLTVDPSTFMAAMGVFMERRAMSIDLNLVAIHENEDGSQVDKPTDVIRSNRIHCGFVVR